MMKLNEILFSLLVKLSEERFCLSYSVSVADTYFENYLPAEFISFIKKY